MLESASTSGAGVLSHRHLYKRLGDFIGRRRLSIAERPHTRLAAGTLGSAASPTLGERSRLALSCSLELGELLVQLFLGRRQLRNLPLQLRDQPHQLVALRGREVLGLTHSQSIKLVQYSTTPLPTPIPLINYWWMKGRCFLASSRRCARTGHTVEGAQYLWERDKYHFQKWAVEQVEGFVTTRRSADGGVDGRLYFAVPHARDLQSMVIEVKGGANVGINVLRELKGVLDYDDALMAGLIVMQPLGPAKQRNFDRFMGQAGTLEILGIEYPKMQILTVGEILEGQAIQNAVYSWSPPARTAFPGDPSRRGVSSNERRSTER